MVVWVPVWLWAFHWMGLDNGSGPIYLFWSGFGSDLGMILGALIATIAWVHVHEKHWRTEHTCHESTCTEIALRHWVNPETHERVLLCHMHHPHEPLTHAQIIHLHRTRYGPDTEPVTG